MIKKTTRRNFFEYENFRYSIGDWMRCSEESDYAGLSGIILGNPGWRGPGNR